MWTITWSWQAPGRIAAMAAAEGGMVISSGLDLFMLEVDSTVRWQIELPFKAHALCVQNGVVAVLAAHGFYVISTSDGSMLSEGRSTPGGFTDVAARPGGGWILSGRKGHLHLFSHEGRGIRRLDSGKVRRLLGWLDREHMMWQAADGRLWCARLAQSDQKRCLEDRVWSWVTPLMHGRLLMQSSDGGLWEGVPHPFGWDSLERIEYDSLEPMEGVRSADGWWILGIEGHLHHLSSGEGGDGELLGQGMNLGDLLIGLTSDAMATATRNGLVRRWTAPHLAQSERQGRYQAAAEAALAKNWEERRSLFARAQTAEDEGRLSRAVELYGALGRTEDVRRLLKRQKEGGE
ncbi:hypothetical protein N9K43_00710 [Candidatus Poseidoniales archaeon]|jgi:hypothetical protein|nr:hypothetical protein [Euryarchaeota archaeon]MDA8532199.1 hypothetical protein [Candidatus Poseidoniales archaeon]MDB0005268.1 hypothetical protein [Candidatus Poseidoniaceae archaeon]MDA8551339.1 hypothetical protein [Candidatus Poseidoniales archaeon]MDA8556007.1 hypothetical protein [Candidatus Poseidoniales archaeon]